MGELSGGAKGCMGVLGGCTVMTLIFLLTTMIIILSTFDDFTGFEDAKGKQGGQQSVDFIVFIVIAIVTFVGLFIKNKFAMVFVLIGSIVMVGLIGSRVIQSLNQVDILEDAESADDLSDFFLYGTNPGGDCSAFDEAIEALEVLNEDGFFDELIEEFEGQRAGCRAANTFRIFSLVSVLFNLGSSAALAFMFHSAE